MQARAHSGRWHIPLFTSMAFTSALVMAAAVNGQVKPQTDANAQPGSIDGRVTNTLTGDLVPEATIHLLPLRFTGNGEAEAQSRSQADGTFRFASVLPGQYILTAEHDGFVPNVLSTKSRLVVIAPGQNHGGRGGATDAAGHDQRQSDG